jgi:hypothetical protein
MGGGKALWAPVSVALPLSTHATQTLMVIRFRTHGSNVIAQNDETLNFVRYLIVRLCFQNVLWYTNSHCCLSLPRVKKEEGRNRSRIEVERNKERH